MKRARQVDIHHIIPKSILKRMQEENLLPDLHVDIDIPCVPLDKGIHRAFTTPMNRDLINNDTFKLQSYGKQLDDIADFYDDVGGNRNHNMAKIVRAWKEKYNIE